MVNMENLQASDNEEVTVTNNSKVEIALKKRGGYKKHKLDKKIVVKHFLNKKLKGSGGNSKFPLYIQIIFNGKSNYIKSAITENEYSVDDFNFLVEQSKVEKRNLFSREKRLIEKVFQEDYNDHITFRGLLPEGNYKLIKTYDSSYIFGNYNFHDYKLGRQIQVALKVEMFRFAIKIFENNNDDYKSDTTKISEFMSNNFNHIMQSLRDDEWGISALQLLCFYEKEYLEFSKFRELYPSDIWYFDLYLADFENQLYAQEGYRHLFMGLEISLIDVNDEWFKELFLKYGKKKLFERQAIIADIEKLITNNSFSTNDIDRIQYHEHIEIDLNNLINTN